ncbi:N-acetylglucosamine kinase [Saccharopolyspora rosea]|uniref:N-acetylglucosamine kinase n=1 Tax=Saccharopolyspora rosea TaxID=524884 RepID=A0ABW3FP75_9PSEU|nr:BadF/BadG/BcrA/BcrD ATPase family protein [Saccharopolyspora rosea]
MRSAELVLGLDVGGTSSRALVADLAGRALGTGAAAGGNPNSHPVDEAVEQVAAAARAALSGVDPDAVRAGVLGMAGVSKMSDPTVAVRFERAWARLGLRCPMTVVDDCAVAFAAGTSAPDGTVLIAGTGAIAARIERHRTTATADGYGWLLGDEGSAFWLGREAVRAALRAVAHDEPRGALVSAVLARLAPATGEPAELRRQLITAVNAEPPIRLAALAPLVTSAAAEDDPAAVPIVRRAARLLADTAEDTRVPGPIVLAGSLVGADNPVGAALRAEFAARGHTDLRDAGPGAAGAAWLAALDLTDDPDALHARLLG